jgi:predicted MPP superfamily phosphohydrolase
MTRSAVASPFLAAPKSSISPVEQFPDLVGIDEPVVAGLARFSETQVYVSRGTGYWGPPMRLAAPAEITRVTLRTA